MKISKEFINRFVKDFKASNNLAKEYDDFVLGPMIIKMLKHILIPENGIMLDPKKNKFDRVMMDIFHFYIEHYHDQ